MVDVEGADEIATLLELKAEIEEAIGSNIKFTLAGATEASVLALQMCVRRAAVISSEQRPN